jgi:xanthine permease
MIIAATIGVGIGIAMNQAGFEHAPDFIKIVFINGVIVGGFTAILLNAILCKRNKT